MADLNILEEFEINEYEEQSEEEKERFSISCLEEANWSLRKMQILNKNIKEIEEVAKKEIKRINMWKEKEVEKHLNHIEFFKSLLVEYLLVKRKEDKKFRISSPYGSVSVRKLSPKWQVQDNQVLINWLKDNDRSDLVRVKEEPNLVDIKKSFSIINNNAVDVESGEVVQGIYVLEQGEKVVFKIDED